MRIFKSTAVSGILVLSAALGAAMMVPSDSADAKKKDSSAAGSQKSSGGANPSSNGVKPKAGKSDDSKSPAAPAEAAAAAQPEPEPAGNVPHVKPSEALDDFGRRAQQKVKAEQTNESKPHPLQEKYPDYNVVVCEAGCGAGAKIVFKEKKSARKPIDVAEMATTSDAGAQSGALDIVCTAGCYDSKKVLRSVDGPRVSAAAVPTAATAKAAESGSWLSKINSDQAASTPAAAAPGAPANPQVATADSPAAAANPAPKPEMEAAPSAATAPAVSAPVQAAGAPADKATDEAKVVVAEAAASTAKADQEKPVAEAPKAPSDMASTAQVPADQGANAPVTAPAAPAPAADSAAVAPAGKPAGTPAETAAEAAPVKVAENKKPEKESTGSSISVPTDDTEMKAAIEKARAGISEFWSKLESPGEGESDFAIKVGITDKGQTEHFWLTSVVRKDGKMSGIISNTPTLVKSVKQGQMYEFSEESISDWLYKRNGKMVGNETMRPLLKRMPKEQAESYKALYEKP